MNERAQVRESNDLTTAARNMTMQHGGKGISEDETGKQRAV